MAGISDIRHELCLALALWNGDDPILKERMFGLTGPQGNHGEDVKEYWWYLEGLPSHALLRWRYHYPQAAFPYEQLVHHGPRPAGPRARAARHRRLRRRPLLVGRGHLREGLADGGPHADRAREPRRRRGDAPRAADALVPQHVVVGRRRDAPADRARRRGASSSRPPARRLPARRAPGPDGAAPETLFCENETNAPRVFGTEPRHARTRRTGSTTTSSRARPTVNPDGRRHEGRVPLPRDRRGGRHGRAPAPAPPPSRKPPPKARRRWADAVRRRRRRARGRRRRVLRRARAGRHDRRADADPAPGVRRARLEQADVPLQRPPLARRRPGPAAAARAAPARPQQRLAPPRLLRRARDARPVGVPVVRRLGPRLPLRPVGAPRPGVREVPAARAAPRVVPAPERRAARLRVELRRRQPAGPRHGRAPRVPHRRRRDREFLERVFQKLLVNFTWWVNRQDADGNNVFGGGFLGLDNISPIDRSTCPPGVKLEQADGTAWMAYYTLSMLVIAIVLAEENDVYQDMVIKFLEQFVLIARALDRQGLYDAGGRDSSTTALTTPGGETHPVRVQTIAGLIPLLPAVASRAHGGVPQQLGKRFAACASASRDGGSLGSGASARWATRTVLVSVLAPTISGGRCASSSTRTRSSRRTGSAPCRSATSTPVHARGHTRRDDRLRAGRVDDDDVRRQLELARPGLAAGQLPRHPPVRDQPPLLRRDVHDRVPDGLGERTFGEIAQDRAHRTLSIWLRDADGRRPVYGGTERLQDDPAWRDNLLFHEYFHGDNGAGLGAMHQTGWTASSSISSSTRRAGRRSPGRVAAARPARATADVATPGTSPRCAPRRSVNRTTPGCVRAVASRR